LLAPLFFFESSVQEAQYSSSGLWHFGARSLLHLVINPVTARFFAQNTGEQTNFFFSELKPSPTVVSA